MNPSSGALNLLQQSYDLLHFYSPLALVFFLMLGSAFGSFANVVIWRLPRQKSLLRPGSHCPQCGTPIPPQHNIPLISYIMLRGRSACCQQAISIRYPIVELAGMLSLGALYWRLGLSLPLLFNGIWMLLLIILAGIDLEHYRLPNVLVGIGFIFSLIFQLLMPQQSWTLALLGMLVGLLWAGLTLMVGKLVKGKWSGMGDLKLALVLGFAYGPGKFILLYVIASLTALLFALLKMKQIKDHRIPMGPFFALGTWVAICWGDAILLWYLGFFYR